MQGFQAKVLHVAKISNFKPAVNGKRDLEAEADLETLRSSLGRPRNSGILFEAKAAVILNGSREAWLKLDVCWWFSLIKWSKVEK